MQKKLKRLNISLEDWQLKITPEPYSVLSTTYFTKKRPKIVKPNKRMLINLPVKSTNNGGRIINIASCPEEICS
jgi:hypothetical protein